jgi:hypothetical protein
MHRGVAEVAALMSSSQVGWPQWNASAQPAVTASANSSHEFTATVCESRKAAARRSSMSRNAASSRSSRADAESSESGAFPSPSLVDISADPSARSRGPSSSRIGTPRSSSLCGVTPRSSRATPAG